jgi:hypothetical protein
MKVSRMYGDDLVTIEWHGGFATQEGKGRLNKIALISAEYVLGERNIARRHLPLYPVWRWRKSLDDAAEAFDLASRGGWLARRALARCDRRLQAAEAKLDDHLDKIIRQYGLERDLADHEPMTAEDWDAIDRLFTPE